MPVKIKKVDGYRVSTPGGMKARSTTRAKARRQTNLLRAIDRGWKPTGKPARDVRRRKRRRTKKKAGTRRLGHPRTDAERRRRHQRLYGTTKLPKRGSGLRKKTKAYITERLLRG